MLHAAEGWGCWSLLETWAVESVLTDYSESVNPSRKTPMGIHISLSITNSLSTRSANIPDKRKTIDEQVTLSYIHTNAESLTEVAFINQGDTM